MIAGHFGLAALVKSRATYVPLWALMLATVWLDIVFIPLFLYGIETIEPAQAIHRGYGNGLIHARYSHSLIGALAVSALFGAAFARARGPRVAIVLGMVSFSHWLLDLVVHREDLPLWPPFAGRSAEFGFGLWQYPAVSAVMEFLLVIAGAWRYWRAALAVAGASMRDLRRANLLVSLMTVFGVLVLALDVLAVT